MNRKQSKMRIAGKVVFHKIDRSIQTNLDFGVLGRQSFSLQRPKVIEKDGKKVRVVVLKKYVTNADGSVWLKRVCELYKTSSPDGRTIYEGEIGLETIRKDGVNEFSSDEVGVFVRFFKYDKEKYQALAEGSNMICIGEMGISFFFKDEESVSSNAHTENVILDNEIPL